MRLPKRFRHPARNERNEKHRKFKPFGVCAKRRVLLFWRRWLNAGRIGGISADATETVRIGKLRAPKNIGGK